jgi:hypothetical protein
MHQWWWIENAWYRRCQKRNIWFDVWNRRSVWYIFNRAFIKSKFMGYRGTTSISSEVSHHITVGGDCRTFQTSVKIWQLPNLQKVFRSSLWALGREDSGNPVHKTLLRDSDGIYNIQVSQLETVQPYFLVGWDARKPAGEILNWKYQELHM